MFDIVALNAGTCLDATEDLRVSARIGVLERVLAGTDAFWSDVRRCQAVVVLQDHVDHIEGTVEACRKALMTTLRVMLPRNPPPDNFRKLLDAFGYIKNIHCLVKIQLVAGAQFALTWVRKWKLKIDFDTISKGFPPHRSKGI
jgi:hypothetical protein